MPRLMLTFLAIIFSFGVMAQSDTTYSFAGVPLKRNNNTIPVSTAVRSPKLTFGDPLYKPSCYASYLPKNADLVGPYKIRSGEPLHPNIVRSMENKTGKLFLDQIQLKAPNGDSIKSHSFVITLTD